MILYYASFFVSSFDEIPTLRLAANSACPNPQAWHEALRLLESERNQRSVTIVSVGVNVLIQSMCIVGQQITFTPMGPGTDGEPEHSSSQGSRRCLAGRHPWRGIWAWAGARKFKLGGVFRMGPGTCGWDRLGCQCIIRLLCV